MRQTYGRIACMVLYNFVAKRAGPSGSSPPLHASTEEITLHIGR